MTETGQPQRNIPKIVIPISRAECIKLVIRFFLEVSALVSYSFILGNVKTKKF